jgi:hypothetical protein
VNESALHIGAISPPSIILFDARCVFNLSPHTTSSRRPESITVGPFHYDATATLHGDSIPIPGGDSIAPTLVSFAMPRPNGGMAFVMALPDIWAAQARASDTRLLATAVFMHEFTHTQSHALSAKVDSLTHQGLPTDADDDVIQTRFGKRAGFEAAYRHELDLLYAAVAAPDTAKVRALARQASESIDRRRAESFAGLDGVYARAEDIFLTLEGTGQYASYRWLINADGGHMQSTAAVTFLRRGGKRWSQDEGLALFLVLDRLRRDWASRIFSGRGTVLSELHAATVR